MPYSRPDPQHIEFIARYMDQRKGEIEALAHSMRPGCYSSAHYMILGNEFCVWVKFETSIRNDRSPDWGFEVKGQDFDALVDETLDALRAYQADMFGADVERMALAIIQIKHSDGVVTDRALRMADFTQEAIEAIHERAAALANEMSDGKPFEVTFVGAGNHAEVEAA